MNIYFDVPYYKKLTSSEGWEKLDDNETHYHIARAHFRLLSRHLPGPAKIGKKLDVFGNPKGFIEDRIVSIEIETEIVKQLETLEKSLMESEAMSKILSELNYNFGDGKFCNTGGKIGSEFSNKVRESFSKEFKISTSVKKRINIKYEVKGTITSELSDRLCPVQVFQQCAAELYLLRIDFLHIIYERSLFGLRKKKRRYPFPNVNSKEHPNVIKMGGIPLCTVKYWELLPKSSLIIKDLDYKQEVEDETEILIETPNHTIKERPYWEPPKYPTLYQLARVAFPKKWIDKKHSQYTKEELMEMEIGEAEEIEWIFRRKHKDKK